jgi:hypothetical protein
VPLAELEELGGAWMARRALRRPRWALLLQRRSRRNTTGPGQAPRCDDAGGRTRPTGGSRGGRRRRSSSVEHQISSSRRRWSSSVEHRTTEAAAPSRGGCRSSLAPRAPPASATVTTTLQHLLLSPVLLPARSTDPPMAPRHVGVPRHPRLRQISRSGRLPSFSRGVSSAPLRAVFLETATGKWIARQWRTPVWVV